MARSVLVDGRRRSYITQPANYGQKFPAEILTREEMSRLLAACSRRGPAGLRNRALIVAMWRGGLRIAEALALKRKDVDLDAGTITVLHGKGDRARTVGIDPDALAVIEHWIQLRRKLGIGPASPLFCTISGETAGRPLWTGYVREMLKKTARKASIEKRVHPHGLRHTHAAELAREGVPVHVIRRQLGHSSLATTERYIDHLTPMEVVRVMQQRTWANHDRTSAARSRARATGQSERPGPAAGPAPNGVDTQASDPGLPIAA